MFYHTVVLESGDVVIALEADSNRSPLEKGHAIRRADRDGLLSGCPANSKMTVGPLVRIRFIESADRGGHQRSARADDRQFNRVAGPRGRCDSSLRAFARSSAVCSGFPGPAGCEEAHGTGEPGQQRPALRELAHAPSI